LARGQITGPAPRLQPWELAQQIERGDDIVVVDVRAALAPSVLEQRIPGALRVELASL
jgi:rhodanese-related sulfurtransferase